MQLGSTKHDVVIEEAVGDTRGEVTPPPNVSGLGPTLMVDPRSSSPGVYRSLREAVDAAPSGSTIVLAPVMYNLGVTVLNLNKSLRFVRLNDLSGRMPEIVGLPTDGSDSMVFIRNQEQDIHIRFEDVSFRVLREPDTINDWKMQCVKVQGGRRGVLSVIEFDRCKFSRGTGGVVIEHNIFGDNPSDNDLRVEMRDCLIEDTFDDRDAQGNKVNSTHAGAMYHNGGTLIMERCTMRRIGYVPGSPIYRKSNKNQGIYALGGVRRIVNCLAEDVSHCAFQYRAGVTYSEGNVSRLSPMGFQFGHDNQPGQAVVVSVNDRVADASDIDDPVTGIPTVTCGVHIDEAAYVSVSGFQAWNVTGRGGWGGLHLGEVTNTIIDARDIRIDQWPSGGVFTLEPLNDGQHRFERVYVVHRATNPAIIAPDLTSTGFPEGGDWLRCDILTLP